MAPTLENGKVCYIEMPATDIRRSADFYQEVFGWRSDSAATVKQRSTTRLGK